MEQATTGIGKEQAKRGPSRANVGFELAKGSQRWNELLAEGFAERGFPEVRPAFGSVLLPLYEEDGLRMGEIAVRARLSKQTMTTLVRRVAAAGLVELADDPDDARATRIVLTERARTFGPIGAEIVAELEGRLRERLGDRGFKELRRGLASVNEL